MRATWLIRHDLDGRQKRWAKTHPVTDILHTSASSSGQSSTARLEEKGDHVRPDEKADNDPRFEEQAVLRVEPRREPGKDDIAVCQEAAR